MEEELKHSVQAAFAGGLCIVWLVMAAIGGGGLLISFLMEALPLHTSTDKSFGIAEKRSKDNNEQTI